MNQLDVLYRAFTEYKKQTEADRDCERERKAIIASAGADADVIRACRTVCIIEEDWIHAVEEGLPHVEKAIGEGRQYIDTKGEVVPIEKVKRVSKDSVAHLAKHSDLISRKPEENLIPDKLYMVERMSDFAVYENRFLYMLLCYLKSFIGSRYEKIAELSRTYRCGVTMRKSITGGKRKTVLELKLDDERTDDPYVKENNPSKPLLDRIDALLKTVMHLLARPLIQDVSKAPMLKPPITKTNVLKMNRNFKGAVALYEFVTSYDKPGYVAEQRETAIHPFPDGTAEDFAETIMLLSFLTYENALGLQKSLRGAYEAENARRKEAEAAGQKERLAQLKRRIAESGSAPMEYMLLLEKRNKALESRSKQLNTALREIKRLQLEGDELKRSIVVLNEAAAEKNNEIDRMRTKHAEESGAIITRHAQETADLLARHKLEKEETVRHYQSEIDTLRCAHESAVYALEEALKAERTARDKQIAELQAEIKEERARRERQLAEAEESHIRETTSLEGRFRAEIGKLESVVQEQKQTCERLTQSKIVSDSRVNALRKEFNLIPEDEDFTSKESFDELEHQYKVFKAFFKKEWKKAKRNIRKEILQSDKQER